MVAMLWFYLSRLGRVCSRTDEMRVLQRRWTALLMQTEPGAPGVWLGGGDIREGDRLIRTEIYVRTLSTAYLESKRG